jgi:hypothetical protein
LLVCACACRSTRRVDLGRGAVLGFRNAEREKDCLIEFPDTPWHTHDDLVFADARGNCIELDYINLLTGLKEGRVLICEQEVWGRTVDRWLIHSEYNDKLKYLQERERIIIHRAAVHLMGEEPNLDPDERGVTF